MKGLRQELERLYSQYNRRRYVAPDPLQFLYAFEDVRDREVVGMIAASLAFGNVKQIVASIERVIRCMSCPKVFLEQSTAGSLRDVFRGFRHRFVTGEEVVRLLLGMRQVIWRYGSLEACFAAGLRESDSTVESALAVFVDRLGAGDPHERNYLLPSPKRGSACKHLNLFLRWMVRRDDVDPGGWTCAPAAKLLVPLDTHMFRAGRELGFTQRRQADWRAVLEVSEAFRSVAPEDPVRYDFSMTRLAMRSKSEFTGFIQACKR